MRGMTETITVDILTKVMLMFIARVTENYDIITIYIFNYYTEA
jgi:hypothetical protein